MRGFVMRMVAPPSDPGGGAAWAQNLPAGMTEEVDIPFTEWPAEGIYDSSNRWLWSGDGTQVAAHSSLAYGPNAARTSYPGTPEENGSGGLKIESRSIAAKRLYMCFEQILLGDGVDPYVTSTVKEKLIYPLRALASSGPSINMEIPPGGTADGPARFTILTQVNDPPYIPQPENGVYVLKDVPQIIECYLQMNTGALFNGVWGMWIDGVEAVYKTDMQYSNDGDADSFDFWRLDGTRGGGISSVPKPAGGQFREWSRVQVYKAASLP